MDKVINFQINNSLFNYEDPTYYDHCGNPISREEHLELKEFWIGIDEDSSDYY